MTAEAEPRAWFEKWRRPSEFFDAARDSGDAIPLSRPLPQYLRDAWMAGAFARIYRDAESANCTVRLVPEKDQFPDAQLQVGDSILNFEITIADEKGRRMWDEHKEWAKMFAQGKAPTSKASSAHREIALEAIPRMCEQKAAKRYPRPVNLLVNSQGWVGLTPAELANLTASAHAHFDAVYLLCGMDAIMTWPTVRVLKGCEPL